jgi:DNA-binding protein YbaB
MSMSGEELIRQATEELRRKQEGLLKARSKLDDATTKVKSKDGMVTVVLDARGQLTSINFNSQRFRKMAPAELGSILVDTVTRAQEEFRDRVFRAYQEFLPDGIDARGLMAGKTELNEMFEDAMRQADEMMAGGEPRFPRTWSAKGGKVNGS